ncbi:MAG TPA: SRPBCC family protein [Candidatus Acidoferrum sp.]|nr:SRPBCC family protein [Candidatus Acidoferrum sp.]
MTTSNSTMRRITNGIGWFSIGIGAVEVLTPGLVAKLTGVQNRPKNRALLRLYGLRGLAAGIGILTEPRPAGWLWARVAGDAVDLSSLARAAEDRQNDRARVGVAMASVIGVTALDMFAAKNLNAQTEEAASADTDTSTRIVRTIIVDRPSEDAYRFLHNFENAPRFMTYLQSVRYTGDRRTHWIAKGPSNSVIEWDAETVADEANRLIAWRTADGAAFGHSGSVRFERAPGDRGTLVRLEVDFSRNRSAAMLRRVLQMGLGRRIMHDLRNFKQVLEVGEITQSEASIYPGMHPAQPPAELAYQH